MGRSIACFFFLFGIISPSAAQENWQITLAHGDTLSRVGLVQLRGDSLEIVSHGSISWINVAAINEVRSPSDVDVWETAKDGAFYTGIIAGMAAAVAIAISAHSSPIYSFDPGNTTVKIYGAILGAVSYGVAFALVGGTIAGIVALVEDQDTVYDLSNTSLKGKQYILQTILKE